MDHLRSLHRSSPETFTTPVLADRFNMSPEAIRRILKSKWVPSVEERERRAAKEVREREERKVLKREKEKREWEVLKGAVKAEMQEEEEERRRAWDAVKGVLSRGTEEVLSSIPEVSGEMGEEEVRSILRRDAERGVDVGSEVLSIVKKRRRGPRSAKEPSVWTAGPDRAVTSKLSVL